MTAIAMTADRLLVEIDHDWIETNANNLGYTQAADGVWVPTCDIHQYERGDRCPRNKKVML
jgi:hypothetical protein